MQTPHSWPRIKSTLSVLTTMPFLHIWTFNHVYRSNLRPLKNHKYLVFTAASCYTASNNTGSSCLCVCILCVSEKPRLYAVCPARWCYSVGPCCCSVFLPMQVQQSCVYWNQLQIACSCLHKYVIMQMAVFWPFHAPVCLFHNRDQPSVQRVWRECPLGMFLCRMFYQHWKIHWNVSLSTI